MTAGARVALFGAGLIAVFAAAAGVGAAVGPIDVGPADHGDEHVVPTTHAPEHGEGHP